MGISGIFIRKRRIVLKKGLFIPLASFEKVELIPTAENRSKGSGAVKGW